jgi:hypothetical protein
MAAVAVTVINMDFLTDNNLLGLVIGLCTFLIIGIGHPIVIKSEYHFGTRCWWVFALVGVLLVVASILVRNVIGSTLLGVAAFTSFWSILEIVEQQERVRKGWFPRNPHRKYPFDKEKDK